MDWHLAFPHHQSRVYILSRTTFTGARHDRAKTMWRLLMTGALLAACGGTYGHL
jgi:hypothetical protein